MKIDIFGENVRSAILPGDGFRKRHHLVRKRKENKFRAATLFILRAERTLCRLPPVAH